MEVNLLLGLFAREPGQYQMHRIKIQKVNGVGQGVQEILNTALMDMCTAIRKPELNLPQLRIAETGHSQSISIGNDPLAVEIKFLFLRQPI